MPCITGPSTSSMADIAEAGTSSSLPEPRPGLPLTKLRSDLLDFLCANDKAHFKSQQIGDPELSVELKRKVAEELLDRSPAQFLGRYGQFLLETHLDYFKGEAGLLKTESYEIAHHLRVLKRFYCKETHDVDVKNRRYDALQKMLAEGNSYFSEDEMRQRNPYLYEQLVGQYLTEEERHERETPDLENISLLNLMLLKMSRDETKELKNKQEKEENGEDSSSSSEESDQEDKKNWNERGTWGEISDDVSKMMDKRKKKKKKKKVDNQELMDTVKEISDEEKVLLMREFVSTMYQSFIDGNDADFDYSHVDSNPDYDCIEVRERDEEEKYFDAETPEDEEMEEVGEVGDSQSENPLPPPPSLAERLKAREEEEDSLDAFMRTVVEPASTSELTSAFRSLCQQSRDQPHERSRVLKKSHVIKINLKQD